jgi:hypothetical protein
MYYQYISVEINVYCQYMTEIKDMYYFIISFINKSFNDE